MPEKIRTKQHDPDSAEDVLEESGLEGTETEEDLGSVDPAQFGRAIVSGTDWTADTIISEFSRNSFVFCTYETTSDLFILMNL